MPTSTLGPDLERMGIFKEMSYHTVRDPYVSALANQSSNFKGKQMAVGHAKSRSALRDGYFTEFQRIFAGDSLADMAAIIRMQRKAAKKLIRGKDWVPPSTTKPITSSGSNYDTFTGPIPYFKPDTTRLSGQFPHQKNILTSPGKKGTGSYVNVTLNPYPLHQADPYDRAEMLHRNETNEQRSMTGNRKPFYTRLRESEYFDLNPFRNEKLTKRNQSMPTKTSNRTGPPFKPSNPGKKAGGCKAGCLNPFPTYQASTVSLKKSNVTRKAALRFAGCSLPYPISSIVNMNVKRAVNTSNYKQVKSVVYSP